MSLAHVAEAMWEMGYVRSTPNAAPSSGSAGLVWNIARIRWGRICRANRCSSSNLVGNSSSSSSSNRTNNLVANNNNNNNLETTEMIHRRSATTTTTTPHRPWAGNKTLPQPATTTVTTITSPTPPTPAVPYLPTAPPKKSSDTTPAGSGTIATNSPNPPTWTSPRSSASTTPSSSRTSGGTFTARIDGAIRSCCSGRIRARWGEGCRGVRTTGRTR
mmetsp:Transcript_1312/g.2886  ORF Transcript_1312/g.2886 Transcript_1312/m.2886 type:complete len:217 (+) Transcript_1312:937-1587(+)